MSTLQTVLHQTHHFSSVRDSSHTPELESPQMSNNQKVKTLSARNITYIDTKDPGAYFLNFPGLGKVIYFVIRLFLSPYYIIKGLCIEKEGEVKRIYSDIKNNDLGLTDSRIYKIADFIVKERQKLQRTPLEKAKYYQSNNFACFDGDLPRDVIVMPDGEIIIKAYDRMMRTEDSRISRAISIKPKVGSNGEMLPSTYNVSQVFIRRKDNGDISVTNTRETLPVNDHVIGPEFDVTIINSRTSLADLQKLYPKYYDEKDPSTHHLDTLFYAYYTGRGMVSNIVNLGQRVASSNETTAITHTEMCLGMKKVKVKNEDGTTDYKHVLVIQRSAGEGNQTKDFIYLDIKDILEKNPNKEFHFYRRRSTNSQDTRASENIHFIEDKIRTFVNRNTQKPQHREGKYAKHQGQLRILHQHPDEKLEADSYANLYPHFDCVKSVFKSMKWRDSARQGLATTLMHEVFEHRDQNLDHSAQSKYFCSAFTARAYQVANVLASYHDHKDAIKVYDREKGYQFADELYEFIDGGKEFIQGQEKLVAKKMNKAVLPVLEKKLQKLMPDDACKAKISDLVHDLSVLLDEVSQTAFDDQNNQYGIGIEAINKQINELFKQAKAMAPNRKLSIDSIHHKKLFQLMARVHKEVKQPFYEMFAQHLKDAEEDIHHPMHHLFEDDLFKLHSRWLMPSTQYGLYSKHAKSVTEGGYVHPQVVRV